MAIAIKIMAAGGFKIWTMDLNGNSHFEFEGEHFARRWWWERGLITMRDRSKNRKPLQRGRNLSIEAIQTVQALKRMNKKNDGSYSLQQVFNGKVKRLLKSDVIAVLRELLRQNETQLAIKVFEDVRKEHWYKPQVSLYADMIAVSAANGLFEEVEFLYMCLKSELKLEPDNGGFNALLTTLMSFNLTGLVMDCFYLMKGLGCEPDKSSFTLLIDGFESNGETALLNIVRLEAQKYFGEEFVHQKREQRDEIGL